MSWLGAVPAWCWWLIALGVVAGGQQHRVVAAQIEADAARLNLVQQARIHQSDLAAISAAAASQARQALEKQQQAIQAMRDIDTKLTKEKTDALTENERLRRAVADGYRRLRVTGGCTDSAGGGEMYNTAGAPSLGNVASIELAPAVGRNILDIRAGIIADHAALKALQQYVDQVCLTYTK